MIPFRNFFRRKNLRWILITLVPIIIYTIFVNVYLTDKPSWLLQKTKGNLSWSTATSYFADLSSKIVSWGYVTESNDYNPSKPSYLRTDGACRIPQLSPLPSSIKHLIYDPNTGNCEANYSLLFESTPDFELIPQKSLIEMKQIGIKSCCYKLISRRDGLTRDDDHQLSESCYSVSLDGPTSVLPEHEFLAIYCESDTGNKTLATESFVGSKLVDTHAFVPIKSNVEERIQRINKQRIDMIDNSVNVVIVGFDSLSHMNFLRSMPKSHEFLTEELDAVEMHGYNSVGYNTYGNILIALTSQNSKDIEHTCNIKQSFDNCPFIWKKFSEQGFRTIYGEDAVKNRSDGMSDGIFNYGLKGFRIPPTDYYLRSFGMVAERMRQSFTDVCYGPRLAIQMLLDYTQKLAYAMGKDKRYFQFLWSTTISHGGLNDGRHGDKHLLSTLEWFKKEGYFNQTIFILMSDHGLRWGPIMDTMQGTLELRMPLLYFVIPSWFKEKYSQAFKNLRDNQDRLTTPYDLYETLSDLISLEKITTAEIQARESHLLQSISLPRGISLFLPIPLSRTCQMAQIEDHYCVCRALKSVSTKLPVVRQVAAYAVGYIKSIISKYSECTTLSLAAIQRANVGIGLLKEEIFQISFETAPGGAKFEATVTRSRDGAWHVSGTIDRRNLYGNQSHCVQNKEAKLYCYCNDLVLMKRT